MMAWSALLITPVGRASTTKMTRGDTSPHASAVKKSSMLPLAVP